MTFYQKLAAITSTHNSLLCVGLDSELSKLPPHLANEMHPQFEFNRAIIDATADLVCAYKPNTAFYEAQGDKGIHELKLTCDYLTQNYPAIPIIIDAKRADIGGTNTGYAEFVFEYLGADAVTIHPYLGQAAVQPFLDYHDKGIIVLCRTSNPGAGEFQDLPINGQPLYLHIAEHVANTWNTHRNCALVVGATYPTEMKAVRAVAPELPFLVPGIGAQGGDLTATVQAGVDVNGAGMMINSSRGIIFAANDESFAAAARAAATTLRDDINYHRQVLKGAR